MKRILFAALLTFALLGTGACDKLSSDITKPEVKAAVGLASRVIPGKSGRFVFEQLPDKGKDYFRIKSEGRKIVIGGNNANSMAVGLNYYLKYFCKVEVGWFDFDSFRMPCRLPKIESAVEAEARVDNRFFLNYCTYGYTMPWWGWKQWERLIDWMALNGVNMPLSITGQESIWYQIWTEMGLSDKEVRGYFTGPAHLPWHRMQNIDRWGGPLPESWLEGQMELQKKITARERELNMKPVLPAFSGHVPRELARLYPDAPITRLNAWAGYSDEYACSFLDPMSELYSEIQKKFIEKETEIYGSSHIYGIDIFNELTPPSWEPEYLARASRQIHESLREADSLAVWLQMGWMFYCDRDQWNDERIEAYLTSFPTENQILLDYYCEHTEVWKSTDKFFGVPYVWCYLGNFGGNSKLTGNFSTIDERLENTFVNGGGNFKGIGSTLEGFDCNPYVYEYVFEKAWNIPEHNDISLWTEKLADQRVGRADGNGRAAWKLLVDSIYCKDIPSHSTPLVTKRPSFGRAYGIDSAKVCHDSNILLRVLGLLLEAEGRNSAYSFDLANISRQFLSERFITVYMAYEAAFKAKDRGAMKSAADDILEIMDDMDAIASTQKAFLVGKWIADARACGKDEAEADYFESNARNLLTTWSDADMGLNDYAVRSWGGLISSYYKVRWNRFIEAVDKALDEGAEFDSEHYSAYRKEICSFERQWWAGRPGEFPSEPSGNAGTIARNIFEKYSRQD